MFHWQKNSTHIRYLLVTGDSMVFLLWDVLWNFFLELLKIDFNTRIIFMVLLCLSVLAVSTNFFILKIQVNYNFKYEDTDLPKTIEYTSHPNGVFTRKKFNVSNKMYVM